MVYARNLARFEVKLAFELNNHHINMRNLKPKVLVKDESAPGGLVRGRKSSGGVLVTTAEYKLLQN